MQIPRRILERNFKFVLACLKDKPHEVIEVTDGAGIVLFCILSTSQKGKNLSTQVEPVDEQIKKTVDTPTRDEVFQALKKQIENPSAQIPNEPSEIVGRKDKKFRVLGQSPYGRPDIKYTSNFGA